MRSLPYILLAIWMAATLFGCRQERQSYVPNAIDGETTPTMSTTDVETFISDSGYTRYHISTPVWLMFEDADEPFWRFPDGLQLEQYDLQLRPESTVDCDSAVYYSRKRIWRLDGNVIMVNTAGDSFLTQQLFWDQNMRKIHSDSFIHIVRTDRIIEGYGFESDQSMNEYTVHHPTAILPVERRDPNQPVAEESTAEADADTMAADTVAAPVRRSLPVRPKTRSLRPAPAPASDTPAVQPLQLQKTK